MSAKLPAHGPPSHIQKIDYSPASQPVVEIASGSHERSRQAHLRCGNWKNIPKCAVTASNAAVAVQITASEVGLCIRLWVLNRVRT